MTRYANTSALRRGAGPLILIGIIGILTAYVTSDQLRRFARESEASAVIKCEANCEILSIRDSSQYGLFYKDSSLYLSDFCLEIVRRDLGPKTINARVVERLGDEGVFQTIAYPSFDRCVSAQMG